eukprot:342338-Rhodomonas_salina.1
MLGLPRGKVSLLNMAARRAASALVCLAVVAPLASAFTTPFTPISGLRQAAKSPLAGAHHRATAPLFAKSPIAARRTADKTNLKMAYEIDLKGKTLRADMRKPCQFRSACNAAVNLVLPAAKAA